MSDPGAASPDPRPGDDPRLEDDPRLADEALAGRIQAAHQMIAKLAADSDLHMRLHLRLIAICAALKVPGASAARGRRRLERLIAEAEQAGQGTPGAGGEQPGAADLIPDACTGGPLLLVNCTLFL